MEERDREEEEKEEGEGGKEEGSEGYLNQSFTAGSCPSDYNSRP